MEDLLLGVARFVALVIDAMAVAIVGAGAVDVLLTRSPARGLWFVPGLSQKSVPRSAIGHDVS